MNSLQNGNGELNARLNAIVGPFGWICAAHRRKIRRIRICSFVASPSRPRHTEASSLGGKLRLTHEAAFIVGIILSWHARCITPPPRQISFRRGACPHESFAVMPYGLYLSAEGAYVQSQRLDVLANNMANVSHAGLQARCVAVSIALCRSDSARSGACRGTRALDDIGGGVKVLATATDFSRGPLAPSKNDTDMAINGDAFFVVRHGNKDMLTRAGNFQLTAAGRLVTQDGDPVLSDDGNPIEIDPDAGPWQITPDGSVSQGGETDRDWRWCGRGRWAILAKVGENLFAPLAPPRPVPDEERQVLWHQVEQSTVQAVGGNDGTDRSLAGVRSEREFDSYAG